MSARTVIGLFTVIALPLILFMGTGTLDWGMAWGYAGIYWVAALGSRLILLYLAPDLLVERGKFATAKGVPRWDPRLSIPMGHCFRSRYGHWDVWNRQDMASIPDPGR